jgi:hypothetical protein
VAKSLEYFTRGLGRVFAKRHDEFATDRLVVLCPGRAFHFLNSDGDVLGHTVDVQHSVLVLSNALKDSISGKLIEVHRHSQQSKRFNQFWHAVLSLCVQLALQIRMSF